MSDAEWDEAKRFGALGDACQDKLVSMLKKHENDFTTVVVWQTQCLIVIEVVVSTSIKEKMKGVLVVPDNFGRNRYQYLDIRLKDYGRYCETIEVSTNDYTITPDKKLLMPKRNKSFNWDKTIDYKIYGYPCRVKLINEDTIEAISCYVGSLLKTYKV